ncbi:MAG: hypothetical protein V2J13_06000 [Cycloclasticus sp.]|nr:hypothetical protein [Cycloclasticus sp.]
MSFSTPSKAELKDMLGMLFTNLEVQDCDPLALDADDLSFGLYLDDDDNPVTLVVCDLPFCAYMGSSMTMLPPPVAADVIKSGKLEDMMVGNIKEVMNIVSRLFMLRGGTHLRFATLHSAQEGLPDSVSGLLGNIDKQVFFDVEVPRYGAGKVGFLVPNS